MADHSFESWMAIPCQIDGISLNTGVGWGRAVLHQSAGMKTTLDRVDFGVDDAKSELIRLDHALAHMVDEIQILISQQSVSTLPKSQADAQQKLQTESRDILDAYLLLANDPGWKRQLREKVQAGVSAVEAVDQTFQFIQKKLKEKGEHSIWQARVSDFQDLSSRLKRYLTDSDVRPVRKRGDSPIIVIADRIGPAELLDYDRTRLVGLVLVEHSQTSHVAIVARSLKIPVVGGMQGILREVNPGDSILVDGNEGRVYIRPLKEIIRHFDTKSSVKKTRPLGLSREVTAPLSAQTLDGVPVSLLLNAGLVEDVDHIEAAGAEGVGLYRTEIPFMMRSKLPNVAEQTKLYREILKRTGNYPIVFRTLDVSGDKVLPYLARLKSESLTVARRTTQTLDRPILLRYQLRALIRASADCELSIMLPMIAEANEIQAARSLLDEEIKRERVRGKPVPTKIRLGAMIEVPSLVFQLPRVFPHVDFLSLGSNDLFRFFYAIDREYPELSDQYDVLSPTFLNLLKSIQNQCQLAQIPLSVCGEMAGRPLEALALIGLGYRTLSMSASALPVLKGIIRNLTYQEISDYMSATCASSSQSSIRQSLRYFAKDHGIHSF
ncbi:MAG: ptsI [Alphaproteobacteria bacterium]|jgi:phosphotransferase system enzyme I (PtsP)|nr:ptsI [Alphaproteobacteria bacterium]MDF3033236.1 ptsI [Alphaproteobacteria bacterium]